MQQNFTHVDVWMSRPGSEDPHQRKLTFLYYNHPISVQGGYIEIELKIEEKKVLLLNTGSGERAAEQENGSSDLLGSRLMPEPKM